MRTRTHHDQRTTTLQSPPAEIAGRDYHPRGRGVLITRAHRDSPPPVYHVSTPDRNDDSHRLFWLFFLATLAGLAWLFFC